MTPHELITTLSRITGTAPGAAQASADMLGITYRALMHYQAGDRPIPAPLARLVRLLDWLQQTGQLDADLPHLRDDD